ncbi:MAG TPA: hypothetical protein VIO94_04280 [Phenylobacterium sp.]
MTAKRTGTKTAKVTLQKAFEAEQTRRDAERQERENAERRQQEEDLARAEELQALLAVDPEFLDAKGLTLDRRRYTVTLDHAEFRIAAYFEGGQAMVRSADKRSTTGGVAPRKEQVVQTVEDAVMVMAQYLADERI